LIYKKLRKASAFALALLVGWASWDEPNLPGHAALMRLHVSGLRSRMQVQAARQQVAAVQACVIDPQSHVATVLYREADVSGAEIERVLSVGGTFRVTHLAPVAYAPADQQGWLPARYRQALECIRFALNLRRLFV
jgi:hypothetical protein